MSASEQQSVKRDIGWVHGTGIVVGAIVGIGIFLNPGKVAAIAGSPLLALSLWAIGGLIALCGALSLAEVGARFPTAGGQLMALRHMLGPLPAFLYGWCLLVAIQTGVLVLITFFAANNLAVVLLGNTWSQNPENNAWITKTVASVMILSLCAANLRGAKQGAWVQTSTSIAKILILSGLIFLGLWKFFGQASGSLPAPTDALAPSSTPLLAGMAAVLFSYGGFHQITWVAGEIKDPQRTVPKSIVLGILIVVVGYVATNWAYFALLPFNEVVQTSTLAAEAVGSVFPEWARRLTAGALCISAYGIANASLLTAPRVYSSLAEKGLFFEMFARIHPRTGVPHLAIWLQTILSLTLLWIVGHHAMDQLVYGVVFVDWTFHILTCAGLLLLMRRSDSPAAYRTPGGIIAPSLFILGATISLAATFLDSSVRQSSLIGLGCLGIGTMVYFWRFRKTPGTESAPPEHPSS